jgi:protein SCO1/2
MQGLESGRRRVALVCAALGLAACGTVAPKAVMNPAAASHRVARTSLDGPTFNHPQTAPSFALRDYRGGLVRLDAYRGKAVLLTFVFTHCRDVCPTIVAGLQNSLSMLHAEASAVQVIGVSVDPKGDTRQAISDFLARHHMTGRMKYLVGTRALLSPVWRQWGVNASNPTADDTVNHTSVVFGIAANGRVMTAYPANFNPAEIAHDVPILARL